MSLKGLWEAGPYKSKYVPTERLDRLKPSKIMEDIVNIFLPWGCSGCGYFFLLENAAKVELVEC